MVLDKEEPVFGSRQLKRLKIGDLVSWVEWLTDYNADPAQNPDDPIRQHKSKRFGVVSELYVEDRVQRRVAMAKVVPMNTINQNHIHEKSLLATSLKLVSKGGMISGEKDNWFLSD
jgi:hypothetical protein